MGKTDADIGIEVPWSTYGDSKPESEGVYRFRVPSVRVSGAVVTFLSIMRHAGAGAGHPVLSPEFDYWDGFKLHVPVGLMWSPYTGDKMVRSGCIDELSIEGVCPAKCPFCGKVPAWKAIEVAASGGTYIHNKPHLFNRWWLECCPWARTPHTNDPRKLSEERNLLLDRGSRSPMTKEPKSNA